MEPASKPGATTRASPTSPTSVARRIPRDTRSPRAEREEHHLQRYRPGDHRRDARVDARLGDVDDADAKRQQQQADERARNEPAARDAKAVSAAASTKARIAPAARKLPAEKRGGSVSTTTLIPRYVDPQTKYTMTSARPDLPGGCAHTGDNASDGIPVRTQPSPTVLLEHESDGPDDAEELRSARLDNVTVARRCWRRGWTLRLDLRRAEALDDIYFADACSAPTAQALVADQRRQGRRVDRRRADAPVRPG